MNASVRRLREVYRELILAEVIAELLDVNAVPWGVL